MTRSLIEPGTRIGRYTVKALIGRGGMGDVYRAVQEDLGRTVALKVLAPALAAEEHFAARLVREARTMGKLEHPAIAPVYDAGSADGGLYLAMRLVGSGATLKNVLSQGAPPTDISLTILRRVGEALDHAHSRGVIHRDVKPANILMDNDGQPVLADFGLAKALDNTSTTVSSDYLGTPVYLAPEQAAGVPIGHRADLYALACVAFELLAGSAPYMEKDALTLLLAHGSYPIPRITERVPSLPARLDDVFARALAKSPTDRYPSAHDFVDAVENAFRGAAARASGTTHSGRTCSGLAAAGPTRRLWSRRPVMLIASGLALATALTGGVLAARPGRLTTTTAQQSTAATRSATRPVPLPPVPVGSKFFEATFDHPADSFYDVVGRGGNSDTRTVDYDDNGALTLAALVPNADAGTDLRARISRSYIVTITYSVRPGSEVMFDLGLRWAVPGELAYILRCDTSARTVVLVLYKDGVLTPLAPAVRVSNLETGRETNVTVTVDGSRLTLWLDRRKVSDVTDNRVPQTAPTIPGLDVFGDPGTGSVRIADIVYYNTVSSPELRRSPLKRLGR